MDTRYLEMFVTIVESGTITGAASELHIAQPALSRNLKKIEEEYGAPLVIRGLHRVTLTKEGNILYQYAKKAIAQNLSIKREIQDSAEGSSGTLRIGAVANFVTLWIKDIFPKFHEDFPNVKFELYEGASRELIRKLQDGECDIAILRGPVNLDDMDYYQIPPDPLTVCYWRENEFFEDMPYTKKIKVTDLKGVPLFINRHWHPLFYPFCISEGFVPNIIAVSDRMRTVVEWARYTPGCAIAPIRSLQLFGGQGYKYKLLDEPKLQSNNVVVTVKQRYLPLVAKNFLNYCIPKLNTPLLDEFNDSNMII